MMSVLLNCSEVNFLFFFLKKKHVVAVSGPAVEARLAPSPATRSHAQTPQGPFPTAPRGKPLLRVWLLLLVIRALSGRLHEARQTFARQ